MTTEASCRLTIDPALSADADADKAIREAMGYLSGQSGFGSPSMSAKWHRHGADGQQIEFELSEQYGTRAMSSRRFFPRRHLFDPQLRDIWALRVWGGLLSLRIDYNQADFRELVNNLTEEEGDGGAAVREPVGHEG